MTKFIPLTIFGASLGGLLGSILFPAVGHWRYSSLYFCLIPALILSFIIILLV